MIISNSTLTNLYTGLKTIFNDALKQKSTNYTQISTIVPSSSKQEEYTWLGKLPKMAEWIGDRVIKNLSLHSYVIKNKDYEMTISVDRNDIEDDNIGVYKPLVSMMGESAAQLPDEIIFGLLEKGFSNKCYDGLSFFNTSHKVGKRSVSNKSTEELSIESYKNARESMMSYTDSEDKPLRIVPNLLVVPPQLEAIARTILFSDTIDGSTNIYKNTAKLIVAPELATSPSSWFLLDASKSLKPLIFQERKKPEIVCLTNSDDENVFMRKEYLYGVDCRCNAGYGLWQLAYGSTGDSI